jgi:hypothetical protein
VLVIDQMLLPHSLPEKVLVVDGKGVRTALAMVILAQTTARRRRAFGDEGVLHVDDRERGCGGIDGPEGEQMAALFRSARRDIVATSHCACPVFLVGLHSCGP